MNAENKIALALINLTTGGIYLKDGKLYHDDLGELPSVGEIAAVVKNRPEIVGDVLLDDALDEGLPVEMDTRSVRRIASGAASVKDVERLTEARAEASRRVFCIGQKVMLEAGKVKDAPVWMKLEKKKTTRSAPWMASAVEEEAFRIILRLIEEGKPVFEDEPFHMPRHDYATIQEALSDRTTELAYLLANELHIRSRLLGVDDTLLDRINEKTSTKEDIHALVEELGRVIADD